MTVTHPMTIHMRADVVDAPRSHVNKPKGTAKPVSPKRRGVWLLLTVALVAGAGVAGHHVWRLRTTQAAAPLPVATPLVLELAPRETARVERADLRRTVRLSGTTQAADQVVVRSQLAARVAEVLVREGDTVERGQILARLDIAEVRAQLDQRLAALASSEAQLMRAERDRAAKLALAQKGWVAQATVDQVESTYRDARGVVAANQALVEAARKAFADAVVKAPIGGVIGKRSTDSGGVVAVGGEVVTILDLSRLEVAAAVPANEIAQVKVGQPVMMRTGLDALTLRGEVTRINPATEPGSQAIVVHVSLPNADRSLRAGVFVSGAVTVAEAKDVPVLPADAIRRDDRGAYVLKIEEGRLARQTVTLGFTSEAQERAEIREGLEVGDVVVVGPAVSLKPGHAVRVAELRP